MCSPGAGFEAPTCLLVPRLSLTRRWSQAAGELWWEQRAHWGRGGKEDEGSLGEEGYRVVPWRVTNRCRKFDG